MLIIFGIMQHSKIFQNIYIVPTKKSSITRIDLSNIEIERARIKTMETQMYTHIREADRANLEKVVGAITKHGFDVDLLGLAKIDATYDSILLQVNSNKGFSDIGHLIYWVGEAGATLTAAHENNPQYAFDINGTKINIRYAPTPSTKNMPDCYF